MDTLWLLYVYSFSENYTWGKMFNLAYAFNLNNDGSFFTYLRV